MPLVWSSALQRSETNFEVRPASCARLTSALMSLTLNVMPFWVTACFGSGSRIAAGVHAWQIPNQVWMHLPVAAAVRLAHASPWAVLHWLSVVQLVPVWLSMPYCDDTASSTPVTPNALPYLAAAESEAAPSQRWLMLSR